MDAWVCFSDDPQSFELTFRLAENYPVDLYYLMDLSNSMADDKEKLASLGVKIGVFQAFPGFFLVFESRSVGSKLFRVFFFWSIRSKLMDYLSISILMFRVCKSITASARVTIELTQ